MQGKAKSLRERLPTNSSTILAMRCAEEHCSPTWLTALPIISHGFDLTHHEFYDALCLRYGWEAANLPFGCACCQRFSLEHALTCKRGGYEAMRHDEVWDMLASLLS